jgi:hypothetical protein
MIFVPGLTHGTDRDEAVFNTAGSILGRGKVEGGVPPCIGCRRKGEGMNKAMNRGITIFRSIIEPPSQEIEQSLIKGEGKIPQKGVSISYINASPIAKTNFRFDPSSLASGVRAAPASLTNPPKVYKMPHRPGIVLRDNLARNGKHGQRFQDADKGGRFPGTPEGCRHFAS